MGFEIANKSMPNDGTQYLLMALLQEQRASGNHSLSSAVLEEISLRFDLPLSRILEVATFYSLLSLEPRGHTLIQICCSPICSTNPESNIESLFEQALGIKVGQTTADGLFSLEHTSCIGACDIAPAALINGITVGNLNQHKIADIIRDNRNGVGNDD